MSETRILVAGIGNIFLGDDGFGVEVARRLAGMWLGEGVRVVDFGIRGFDLAFALLDCTPLTILVDATTRGGEPGTLYTIDPEVDDLQSAGPKFMDGHRLDVEQALGMARQMSGPLGRILVVGCEPATFGGEEGSMELSPIVAAAVDEAVEVIRKLIHATEGKALTGAAITA